MPEDNASTKLPPEKRLSNGQFQKGQCPNKKGRGKGNLAKTTRFLQIMTSDRQKRALKVLDAALKAAEKGDPESRKMVMALLGPFIKREVEKAGGSKGDQRPMVNIIVTQADGQHPVRVAPRVIDMPR